MSAPLIGVLDIQGAVTEHIDAFKHVVPQHRESVGLVISIVLMDLLFPVENLQRSVSC